MIVKNSFLISDINTSENKMMMNESDNQQGSNIMYCNLTQNIEGNPIIENPSGENKENKHDENT
jgi:hypothetical protein